MADEPLNDTNEEVPKLHSRVFNILLENNPELAGDRRGTVLRPPQPEPNQGLAGLRDFFSSCCSPPKGRIHRQPDHVIAFLLADLRTKGSLDGQQRLVVKGRFAPKNFEATLRRYIIK
ncbi:Eukaryotic translation initiation factor 2 subunit beta [Stylosanthes scabra]|uniref:Eukaryotic translation initiation factor 2 subunit beta n=1 Tax=Stylosanthes scabra TaxID=79078 RepID=A0ABU6VHA5_9FABA|nr:Eukaryotic translation initiation factor 2 subunit beta [Stylosanthes scabra]